jgi:hypothetical protein
LGHALAFVVGLKCGVRDGQDNPFKIGVITLSPVLRCSNA